MAQKSKTWKRETAWAMLAVWLACIVYALVSDDPIIIEARGTIIAVITVPIIGFAAAMFGIDWAGKQTKFGNQDQPEEPSHIPPDGFGEN